MKKMILALTLGVLIMRYAVVGEAASVSVGKELAEGKLTAVTLENEAIRVRIIQRAGKVISFVDKKTGHELVVSADGGGDVYSGFCKTREWELQNSELLTARYALSVVEDSPDKAVAEAVYKGGAGNFTGMEFKKVYTLASGKGGLAVREKVQCAERPNYITINIHNHLPLDNFPADQSFFYLVATNGLVKTSVQESRLLGNNLVYHPAGPWIGLVNEKTKDGVLIFTKDEKELNNFYFWIGEKTATMELTFNKVALQPLAALDRWEMEYRILPVHGLASFDYVSPEAVLSVARDQWNVKLAILSPNGLGRTSAVVREGVKEMAAQELTLKAGEPSELSFPAPQGKGIHRLTLLLKAENKSVTAEFDVGVDQELVFAKPTNKIIQAQMGGGVNGFYYYFDNLYLSPDMTTPIDLGLRGNFRDKKAFRTVLETPKGVVLRLQTQSDIRKAEDRIQTEPVTRDGREYIRYVFPSWRKEDYYSAQKFLFSTVLTNDVNLPIYLYAQWEGGRQEPEERINLRIVRIPLLSPAQQLKRLRIGLSVPPEIVHNWPDFFNEYKKIGYNHIELWPWIASNFLCGHLGKGAYKETVAKLNSAGIMVSIQVSEPYNYFDEVLKKKEFYYKGACTLYHPTEEHQEFDVEDVKAVDITGQKLIAVCPSYRGWLFRKGLDMAKTAVDYGFDYIAYDEETWNTGKAICYCARCKNAFKGFLEKKYPKLKYTDPQIFEKNPSQSPELDNAWWDFKTMMMTDIYAAVRKEAEAYAGRKLRISAYVDIGSVDSIKNDRLTDYTKLSEHLDVLFPMFYTSENETVGNMAAKTYAAVKNKSGVGMALSPARTYEYERVVIRNYPPPEAIKYQILETFANGGKEIICYYAQSGLEGALGHKYVSEAVRMTAPVENIIADGVPSTGLQSSNPGVRVRGLTRGNETAILVSEYSRDIVSTTVTAPVKAASDVIDLETGEKVARLVPDGQGFKVELGKTRVRLFHIKPVGSH